jgi:chitinase
VSPALTPRASFAKPAAMALRASCLIVASLGCAPDEVTRSDGSVAPSDAPSIDVAAPVDARPPDVPRDAPRDAPAPRRALWVTGYYAGWMQDAVPPDALALRSLTHVIHFALVPRADGSLDAAENGLGAAHARSIVAAAHAAGCRVLVSVGGAGARAGFVRAWAPGTRGTFVANLVRFVAAYDYDGVDVDVEPLEPGDATAFQVFARALHAALRARDPAALLTAAVADAPSVYVPVQALFDQLNVMNYDTSGPWPGWVTWHNTPLRSGGARFPSTGEPLPSVDALVTAFARAGLDRARLGVGIDFYGYDWSGASGPQQPIAGVTTRTLSYAALLARYAGRASPRWDDAASVPYFSLPAAGAEPAHFVSFDDARSGAAKVDYARREGLGGAMIWELAGGHRADGPPVEREALLTAIGAAAR